MWCKYLNLDVCIQCKTNSKVHRAHGLCVSCYDKKRNYNKPKKVIKHFAWANNWPCCQSCRTDKIKHVGHGLCKRCAAREYGRKKSGYILPAKSGWSKKYEYCIECKTTKNKYESNGLCCKCYSRKRKRKQTGWINIKSGWSQRYEECKQCHTIIHKHQGKGFCSECYRKNYKLSPEQKRNKGIQDRKRIKQDPILHLGVCVRYRIWNALKDRRKNFGSAQELLGCSVLFLKEYLEQKFYPHPETGEAMTWDNYGKGWHVDHIYPISKVKIEDSVQVKKVFHFTNLQPLWAYENFRKSDRILENVTL